MQPDQLTPLAPMLLSCRTLYRSILFARAVSGEEERKDDIEFVGGEEGGENWQAWDLAHLILSLVSIKHGAKGFNPGVWKEIGT